jgi:hypothetical protein
MVNIKIYNKKEKEEYVQYLIEKFEGFENAINVVDELLKVCSQGSDEYDLKEVKKIIVKMYEEFKEQY